jgi:hypothetical protein
MSQLDKWMVGGKISKLVIVITDKDTGEHVERWQFDVCAFFYHTTSISANGRRFKFSNPSRSPSPPNQPPKTKKTPRPQDPRLQRPRKQNPRFKPKSPLFSDR